MLSLLMGCVLAAANGPEQSADTVVICPSDFLPAMRPWITHRQAQGHLIAVRPSGTASQIRASIRQVAKAGRLQYVLLVGDASRKTNPLHVPTHLAKAYVNVRWGSEPEIATDNWYADLDDDELPDLAIGRLPAANLEHLRNMLTKILEYETSGDHGEWRRRINLIAGVGGFGSLVDSVLELTTRKFLTDGVPDSYATHMTYGSWQSPYCPAPSRFDDAVIERFNEGCLFWIYIGHGQRTFLDRVQVPGRSYHIFGKQDVTRLAPEHAAPIAIFLACYTAAFDGPQECLGEVMLRAKNGPVAVLGGTRVTMPYGMAALATGLMDQLFQQRRTTLGQILLHAKRTLAKPPTKTTNGSQATTRQLLDALAVAFASSPELLAAERREHLQLINLLGDPLLRIRQPHHIHIDAPTMARSGNLISLKLHSEIAGMCSVELVCRRGQLRHPAPTRPVYIATSAALSHYDRAYQAANLPTWSRQQFAIAAGSSDVELQVPAAARGACQLRVYIAGENTHALGTSDVFVKRPAATPDRKGTSRTR